MTNRTHSQKYWQIATFLNDQEILKIWDIIDNALDRHGWVGCADDGELSIRVYDDNLKQIEQRMGVSIRNRGNEFSVSGEVKSVESVVALLVQLYEETNSRHFTMFYFD